MDVINCFLMLSYLNILRNSSILVRYTVYFHRRPPLLPPDELREPPDDEEEEEEELLLDPLE